MSTLQRSLIVALSLCSGLHAMSDEYRKKSVTPTDKPHLRTALKDMVVVANALEIGVGELTTAGNDTSYRHLYDCYNTFISAMAASEDGNLLALGHNPAMLIVLQKHVGQNGTKTLKEYKKLGFDKRAEFRAIEKNKLKFFTENIIAFKSVSEEINGSGKIYTYNTDNNTLTEQTGTEYEALETFLNRK